MNIDVLLSHFDSGPSVNVHGFHRNTSKLDREVEINMVNKNVFTAQTGASYAATSGTVNLNGTSRTFTIPSAFAAGRRVRYGITVNPFSRALDMSSVSHRLHLNFPTLRLRFHNP